jgi:hypothetical protein
VYSATNETFVTTPESDCDPPPEVGFAGREAHYEKKRQQKGAR